jgi:hypothetical protein
MSSLTPTETIENKAEEQSAATLNNHQETDAITAKIQQNTQGTTQKVGQMTVQEVPSSTQQNQM